MIMTILSALGEMIGSDGLSGSEGVAANVSDILANFNPVLMIPTYWLQIIVGVYLIQVVFILTSTLVTIKTGRDPVSMTSAVGKNLKTSMLLYFVIAGASIIGLTLIGAVALSGLIG